MGGQILHDVALQSNPRATLTELLVKRLPFYREAADVEVDTSRLKHDEVARTILNRIEEHGGSRMHFQG